MLDVSCRRGDPKEMTNCQSFCFPSLSANLIRPIWSVKGVWIGNEIGTLGEGGAERPDNDKMLDVLCSCGGSRKGMTCR